MSSSIPKKPALRCRLQHWLFSFRAGENLVDAAKHSRHVRHCPDCQQYYKVWQQLQGDLHDHLDKEDEFECGVIMTQIRAISNKSGYMRPNRSLASLKPASLWLWAGVVCMAVLTCVVVYWGQERDVRSDDIAKPVKHRDNPKGDKQQLPVSDSPMEMLVSLQKEQVLIARDMNKFKTMLNERVIIFRQEPD